MVVSTLGITQSLAWASTYYLPAVFTDPISADLHLSRSWFFGIVSAGLVATVILWAVLGCPMDGGLLLVWLMVFTAVPMLG